jgi:hypothetical protein
VRDPGAHAKARVSPHPHVHLLVRRCAPANPGVSGRFLTRPFLRSVRTRFLDRAGDDPSSAFGVFVKIKALFPLSLKSGYTPRFLVGIGRCRR